jgi:hypothetical protein
MMTALDDPQMFTQDIALSRHNQPVGIDPQADRSVGKRRRHAVETALKADQTSWRDALAQVKAI